MESCKRHPRHRPDQSVCPSCLRERLSSLLLSSQTLNKSITSKLIHHSISSTNCSSIAGDVSATASRRMHNRNATEVMDSVAGFSDKEQLKKSRSIGVVSKEVENDMKNHSKKKGFWSKLFHLKGRINDDNQQVIVC